MVRWEPGAGERLRVAALELYVRQGFEQTTVEEIARSVGLTERTFFRYFADKREVLFDPQNLLQEAFLAGVNAAPPTAAPLEMIASALATSAAFFPDDRRNWSRQRQSVIAANPALKERELLKLATLAAAIAEALRARGVAAQAATLAAESGTTVFGVAFTQWIADGEQRSLAAIEHEVLGELAALTTGLATALDRGPA
ncbi:TetR family transcriptional regulator [Pseudonocardia sp. GCM10023141]|uniref:TetR family transcriptional regulator n=1 Tax=Pseudonocardia sp. GCM10023141 TaxID=3252653 RepID=UPI00361F96EE